MGEIECQNIKKNLSCHFAEPPSRHGITAINFPSWAVQHFLRWPLEQSFEWRAGIMALSRLSRKVSPLLDEKQANLCLLADTSCKPNSWPSPFACRQNIRGAAVAPCHPSSQAFL
jgi:hypothetical protein